jgi:Outer membrane protein beta-barrel domain
MMKRFLILPITLLICEPVQAQIPIDPLRLPDEEAGGYIYTFGVNYIPEGREGFDFDAAQNTFNFKGFNQSVLFSFSGSYSFNRHLSISANVNPNLYIGTEKRDFGNRTEKTIGTNTDIGVGLSVEYRPAPGSTLDPRFSVGVAYPWTVTVQSQASLIRDPVIVLASLGYSQPLDSANSSLNLGLGAGFVANERISFSASANYAIPIGDTNLPVSSLSFRTGYNLDDQGNQDIGLRTTLSVRGGDTRLGIGIEWGGRGNIRSKKQNSTSTNNPESTNRNRVNVVDSKPSSIPSPSVIIPTTQPTRNKKPASDSNMNTNSVLAESPRDAIQQLYQRLQEKDAQIEALQKQIIELQRSLERLRCQIPENQESCEKTP